ncbi:MAG: hypothetical protein AWU57_176 [Marinobacter sp. T13-3]|nr:MAG: hypothetical protein AWU57_176 [Marinobacter sp. T13-3]
MSRITLDLNVDLDLNGEDIDILADNLKRNVENAIGNGLLTGDASNAEVEQYRLGVTTDPDHHEEAITSFFVEQVEDGNMRAAGMPRRLARYGLMAPSDFLDEMRERQAVATED